MRAERDGLRAAVDELFRHRPGWGLQAMSTPGLAPQWSFGTGGQAELSIATDGDAIRVYVVEEDRDVALEEHRRIGGVAEGQQTRGVQGSQSECRWQAEAWSPVRLGVANDGSPRDLQLRGRMA